MSQKISRNSPCWCQSGKKYKNCHAAFDEKIETFRNAGHRVPNHSIIKNEEQIQKIRESAKINIAALDLVAKQIKEGMTTTELDKMVHDLTVQMGGIPAPLGYQGFPKSICTSMNEQVCHGIPSQEDVLKNGDIINVDVSTNLNGYYSDSSRMFIIGETTPEKKKLVEIARECIYKGLEQVRPWGFLGDMGQAVHDYAYSHGYTIVREIGGHGIGLEFHEDPWVSYHSRQGEEMLLVPGMMFTIEPMVNMGNEEIFTDEINGWTVYTKDKQPSAQWEIQVLVTEDGYEIITY